MADDPKFTDDMNYEALAQEALRGVIKAALKRAATGGLPGEHHFYITFRTQAPGVTIPKDLLARYPEEMTIVLQHQFWDLAPGETFFSVVLTFGGAAKALSVPYAAVTRFYDPSVQFLLQFEPVDPPMPALTVVETASQADPEEEPDSPDDDGPKVVSLDRFRKK